MRRFIRCVSLVAALAVVPQARAQSDADKSAAAALADAGLVRLGAGDAAAALDLFTRAFAIVPAPSFALYRGRCLVKLGRVSEADASFTLAATFDDGTTASPTQRRAVADAKAELRRSAALRGAVPSASASVQRSAQVGVDRAGRPPTASLVALGVGAAGVAVGITWGAVMLSRKSSLDEGCTLHQCPPEQQRDLDGFRAARTISAVGWGVGFVGVGVGIGLWASAPAARPTRDVRLVVGPASAAAVVTF